MQDNNEGVWVIKPKGELEWIEKDGFRLLVSAECAKDFDNFPVTRNVGYRFAPAPLITDDSYVCDLKPWKRTRLFESITKKFKKQRSKRSYI
jgi:hypothetical protein